MQTPIERADLSGGWLFDKLLTGEDGVMAITAINDDMFTEDVIADPYTYYGRLRAEDPVHWNDKYALWVLTRHDDVVWMTRHHELFSNTVFKNDPRPAYPDINESDLGLYEYVKNYQADQFIQHDRPVHLEMRKVVHGYFTPKSLEEWRPFVQITFSAPQHDLWKHFVDLAYWNVELSD